MSFTYVPQAVACELWAHSIATNDKYLMTWYGKSSMLHPTADDLHAVGLSLTGPYNLSLLAWTSQDVKFDRLIMRSISQVGAPSIEIMLDTWAGGNIAPPLPRAMAAKVIAYSNSRNGRSGRNMGFLFPTCTNAYQVDYPYRTLAYNNDMIAWVHNRSDAFYAHGWEFAVYSRLLGVIDQAHRYPLLWPGWGNRLGRRPKHGRR
jgi:hypothetical protein